MFRFSARDAHAWRDVAHNVGKLSLAGLFATGTLLLAHAYAESPSHAASSMLVTIPVSMAHSITIQP